MHDKHMQTQHDRSAMNNMNSSHPHEGVAALTASAQQQEVTSSRPRGCFCNSRTLQAVCEGLACDCDRSAISVGRIPLGNLGNPRYPEHPHKHTNTHTPLSTFKYVITQKRTKKRLSFRSIVHVKKTIFFFLPHTDTLFGMFLKWR